jgi:predicted aconitase/predicted aconitase with swiveling domain
MEKRMILQLSERDKALLAGEVGPAGQLAMRILVTMAGVYGASHLLDIESAHIDGCLYHGRSGLAFAERLAAGGAQVVVPTTLNVGALDLLHPHYFRGTSEVAQQARALMDAYERMGCRPVWTCAPYQTAQRPRQGSQIAWAESNAIVFANSVLGARTNRYGDFIDICAALTGRAPAVGLHLTPNRRGQLLFRLQAIPEQLRQQDHFHAVFGYYLGLRAGTRIPVIEGLPPETTEDQLKALGAAAASSGAVALFHAVGITPEAETLDDAFQGEAPEEVIEVTAADLREAYGRLSTVPDGPVDVVALGSPHFSLAEFARLIPLLADYRPHPAVEFIVCTNRVVLAMLQQRGWLAQLEAAKVQVVVDTCVVVTPIVRARSGVLMTNSGKFAHYSPGNIGLQVVFGSLEECVRSAALGRVWREEGGLWEGGGAELVLSLSKGEQRSRGESAPLDTRHSSLDTRHSSLATRHSPLVLVDGSAAGEALVLAEPLSLWGGLDAETGVIIDQRHPARGEQVSGRVLVLPAGKGSSSASSILLEAARLGTAPAAILTAEADAILALGAAVARELYGTALPVVVLDPATYARIRAGDWVVVESGGMVAIHQVTT